EEGGMTVELHPGAALSYLPYWFVGPEYDLATEEDESPPRELPVVLNRFQYKTIYRLIPPPGFEADVLPDSYSFRVAEFRIDLDCDLQDDGSVTVSMELDTGNAVIAPEQVEEFRNEVLAMTGNQSPDNWMLPVRFFYLPHRMVDEGDAAEGIRQMIQIAERQPESLFNRGELSSALLRVGLGKEAREVAREMVKDAPDSMLAHWQVAWTHMHDLLGNNLQFGMDRSAALSGCRRVLELDQDNLLARYNLAVLLEHDDLGGRYSSEKDMRQAAGIYGQILKTQQIEWVVMNYGALMLNLGDVTGLRRLYAAYPNRLDMALYLATAELHRNGVRASSRVISRASAIHDNNVLLANVALRIRALRRYDLLHDFLKAHPEAKGIPESIRSLQRYEDVKLDSSDPASVVQTMMARFLRSGQDVQSIRDLYANGENDEVFNHEVESLPSFLYTVRKMLIEAFGRRDVAEDIVSLYEFNAEGDDEGGYIVIAKPLNDFAGPTLRRLVIRDGDQYRIWAAGKHGWQYGQQALNLIDAGKPQAAQRWIDEVYLGEKHRVGIFNPFAASPFAQAKYSASPDDQKVMRLVALLLTLRRSEEASALEELTEIRDQFTKLQRLQIDRVRMALLARREQYRELLTLADKLLEGYPAFAEVLAAKSDAEIKLGMLEQADATLKRLEAKERYRGIWMRRKLLFVTGGHEAVFEYDRELAKEEAVLPYIIHAMPWRSLFVGQSEQMIETAKEAVAQSLELGELSAANHTLACIYADAGHLAQAAETLSRTIADRNGMSDPIDFFVLGRIAEHCGLNDAAKQYYHRVRSSRDESVEASCEQLAKTRLKLLQGNQ
ncbi:MAG: hypothetical protein MI861_18150, partial [Pirellulales bacterium]|nr:hypothetical protein [Pirellulales bacterium]